MPFTVVLIVSANAEPLIPTRIATVNAICFMLCAPSELPRPIDHDVVVAAVSGFEPDGLVEKPDDRRDDEVILLRRMVVFLDEHTGVELVVVREIRREA